MAKYGLTLQPDKTRLVRFERPKGSQTDGKGLGSFDFLGFTHYPLPAARICVQIWG